MLLLSFCNILPHYVHAFFLPSFHFVLGDSNPHLRPKCESWTFTTRLGFFPFLWDEHCTMCVKHCDLWWNVCRYRYLLRFVDHERSGLKFDSTVSRFEVKPKFITPIKCVWRVGLNNFTFWVATTTIVAATTATTHQHYYWRVNLVLHQKSGLRLMTSSLFICSRRRLQPLALS